jgi:DNA-binding PadR family transcriptional regulator
MSIGHTLLGLLESGPRHGYDLKRAFDEKFGSDRPLHYGQVYSTMSRLLKNGLVEVDGVEAGDGPERKRYAITDAGRHRRRAVARHAGEAGAVPAEHPLHQGRPRAADRPRRGRTCSTRSAPSTCG